jgi:hypothetical protein
MFEHRACRVARIFDILYYQDADSYEFIVLSLPWRMWHLFGVFSDCWQANDDFGAPIESFARKCRRAAVRFGQALDKSEADSQTRVLPSPAYFLLLEHLEHRRNELGGNPFTGVPYGRGRPIPVSCQRHGNRPALGREPG